MQDLCWDPCERVENLLAKAMQIIESTTPEFVSVLQLLWYFVSHSYL